MIEDKLYRQESDIQRISALLCLARDLSEYDPVKTRRICMTAIQLAKSCDRDFELAESLFLIGKTYESDNPTKALDCYKSVHLICGRMLKSKIIGLDWDDILAAYVKMERKIKRLKKVLKKEKKANEARIKSKLIETNKKAQAKLLNNEASAFDSIIFQINEISGGLEKLSKDNTQTKMEVLGKGQSFQSSIRKIENCIKIVKARHKDSLKKEVKGYLDSILVEVDQLKKNLDNLLTDLI